MLRFAPTFVGLCVFGLIAYLYVNAPSVYFAVLLFTGFKPWVHPFIDSAFMYAMKDCWEHGVDIYKAVPCDLIPTNKMAYSPLWQRLPFLPDHASARVPVGVVTDLMWIVSLSLLPPARDWREAVLLVAAVPSTMVCFALERNNIDVWMYLLAVAALLLLMRGGVLRWCGYVLFLCAGLLKYYPLVLFGLALRERPARFWAIFAGCFLALVVFVALFWRELAEALPNVPEGPPFANLFAVSDLPRGIGSFLHRALKLSYHASADVAVVLRVALMVQIWRWALALARQPGLGAGFDNLAVREQNWLVAGALVVTGCYMAGENVNYRGIYLMIVLSGLLTLRRVLQVNDVRGQVGWAALLVVPLMWEEALQHWINALLPDLVAGPLDILLWLGRECAWIFLARVLLAVLLVYAMRTPLGRRWVTP